MAKLKSPFIETDPKEVTDTGITSSVNIKGHPVHPMIIVFPITFLISVFFTDIAFVATDELFWGRVSLWLTIAGLVTATPAAVTGLMDFLKINRVRAHTAGWAHMILNVLAVSLSLVSLILRSVGGYELITPWGIVLSGLVSLLLVASGWFGAELVYRHKIAVIGTSHPKQDMPLGPTSKAS